MPRNIPFRGSKKLGNEFDPEIEGTDSVDFEDFDDLAGERTSEINIDYGGADKVEGQGFDRLVNQQQIDEFGTQTVGRVAGKSSGSYSDFIRGASLQKLQSLKTNFKDDPQVLEIIDEEINNRAARTVSTAKLRNQKTGKIVESTIVGQPQGVKGANIAESAGPKYYTESEIAKGTSFYREELATIDKYLTEVKDIDPKIRTALAQEAADLETNLEIEKAMFGQSLEEAEYVESTVKAYLKDPKGLEGLNKPIDKKGKTVLEAATEVVGEATSEGFVDYTTTQTSSGLTTGRAKSYVRDMTDLWGESKGILGEAGTVEVAQVNVKKGDKLPTGGYARGNRTENLKQSFPLDDQKIIERNKLNLERSQLERKVSYLEGLSRKMQVRGVSTPESAAEIQRYKKDITNIDKKIKNINLNLENVAASDAPRGKGGPKIGYNLTGEFNTGKSFPVDPSIGRAGGYGLTEEYRKEIEKAQPGFTKEPTKDFTAEFKRQNPRAAAATAGAPDPGSPLGVNKPASTMKATDLGDITQSKAYKTKYKETYEKVAKTLAAESGKIVDDIAKIDPAILKQAGLVASTIAANFAKRNPTIGAGVMLYSGLLDYNKKKEQDYFK